MKTKTFVKSYPQIGRYNQNRLSWWMCKQKTTLIAAKRNPGSQVMIVCVLASMRYNMSKCLLRGGVVQMYIKEQRCEPENPRC